MTYSHVGRLPLWSCLIAGMDTTKKETMHSCDGYAKQRHVNMQGEEMQIQFDRDGAPPPHPTPPPPPTPTPTAVYI